MAKLSNSPKQALNFDLERRKSFTFRVRLKYSDGSLVNLTGCTLRFVMKSAGAVDDHFDLNNLVVNSEATIGAPHTGEGVFAFQAAELDGDPGEYDYSIVLWSPDNFSTVLTKGVVNLLDNSEAHSMHRLYSATAPTSALELTLRGGDVVEVEVVSLPQGPVLTPSEYAELNGRLSILEAGGGGGGGATLLTASATATATGDYINASASSITLTIGAGTVSLPAGAGVPVYTDGSKWWRGPVVDLVEVVAAPAETTPPTAGTLAASATTETGATLTVTGAADETALHASPYAFSTDNGTTWTGWQASNVKTVTGLTSGTAYQMRHKVRDAANNEKIGTAITVTTSALPGPQFKSITWTIGAPDSKGNRGATYPVWTFTDAAASSMTIKTQSGEYGSTLNAGYTWTASKSGSDFTASGAGTGPDALHIAHLVTVQATAVSSDLTTVITKHYRMSDCTELSAAQIAALPAPTLNSVDTSGPLIFNITGHARGFDYRLDGGAWNATPLNIGSSWTLSMFGSSGQTVDLRLQGYNGDYSNVVSKVIP